MKTAELTGAQLNWAVQQCEGQRADIDFVWWTEEYTPDTNWSQGGPIIEREGINLDHYAKNPQWSAWTPAPERESGEAQAFGPTPLIAAMRCYVVSKLGDEVYVADELKEVAACTK
jgi:hypothetical protein